MDITERQQQVLDFIEGFQLENGKSPTLKEIKNHIGVSSDNSVLKHLSALKKKGYIEKDDTPRGIKLLDTIKEKLQSNFTNLPVLGAIPAGGPVISEEYTESWVTVDNSRVPNPESSFMLRVTGESMINAGIYEGDMLICDSKKEPRPTDIVIALVDGENTVKRLVSKGGVYHLQAENPEYEDIFPMRDLEVQGVVIGLIRTYN
jgi:repressor LexA